MPQQNTDNNSSNGDSVVRAPVEAIEPTSTNAPVNSVSTTPGSGDFLKDQADNFAIISLIFAVIGLPTICCGGICCIPLQIIAGICGILGLKSEKYKTLATIGLVLCILEVVLIVGFLIASVAFSIATPSTNTYKF